MSESRAQVSVQFAQLVERHRRFETPAAIFKNRRVIRRVEAFMKLADRRIPERARLSE